MATVGLIPEAIHKYPQVSNNDISLGYLEECSFSAVILSAS